jgi:glycine oxidase
MVGADMRIVVAGGGIIGLSLAWFLRRAGAEAVVVDSGAPSATWASAGMLTPSFEHGASPQSGALRRFGRASLERWRAFAPELEAASGKSIDYRCDGVLAVAYSENEAEDLRASADETVEFLTGDEARRLAPGLSYEIRLGALARADGEVDPRRVLTALGAPQTAGSSVVRGEARAVEIAGDRVRGLRTAGGALHEADAVVIAAGAASRFIDTGSTSLPVVPVKGEAVALNAPPDAPAKVVRAPGAYLCPKADGRLVIGATESRGDETLEPSPAAIEGLKTAAARAFPPCGAFPEAERWAGLRPGTPDGAPILGRDPRGPEGLYFAVGHYRNGVLFAPLTAEILSRLMLSGEESRFLADFRPDRFDEGNGQ